VGVALRGLTARAWCLLVLGGAATAFGVSVGQRDVLRAGVLLLVLPLVAVTVVSRTRLGLAASRTVTPASVPAGGEGRVTLHLANRSRLSTGLLLLEDRVPRVLGGPSRAVLGRLGPRGSRDVAYRVRPGMRGRYLLGPLTVRLNDPFGLVEMERRFPGVAPLLVTPPVEALPPLRLEGDRGGGDARPRSAAASGVEDYSTREWRNGDDLRRVHWRSTARTGELMVRREEQPAQSRAALVLDSRGCAHPGAGVSGSLEVAVRAAASAGMWLLRSGYDVRTLLAGVDDEPSEDEPTPVGPLPVLPSGTASGRILLERLALLRPGSSRGLASSLVGLRADRSADLLVAVLGRVTTEDLEALARLRSPGRTCVAVLVGAEDDGAQTRAEPAARIGADGWRVVPLPLRSPLAATWPRAALRPEASVPVQRSGVPGVRS
jgi:uncharacterized protein (DUF58 family)